MNASFINSFRRVLKDAKNDHTLRNPLAALTVLFILLLSQPCYSFLTYGSEKNITFEVVLKNNPIDSAVYITGSLDEFGPWKADAIRLERRADGIWTRTLRIARGTRFEYKFTRGSWETEAANADGTIPQNSVLNVKSDTLITVFISHWFNSSTPGAMSIPVNALNNPIQMYYLHQAWKYHPGDDKAWAATFYDDSKWEIRNALYDPSNDSSKIWNKIGWFRMHIDVDRSLVGKPLCLTMGQLAASEIYLNGRLLYKLGRIGNPPDSEVARVQREPLLITFEGTKNQVLAVRYSNYSTFDLKKYNYITGFIVSLSDPEIYFKDAINKISTLTKSQLIYGGIPLILAILHLLFFIFYPTDRSNFYYALCLIAFSVSVFIVYERYFTLSPQNMALYTKIVMGINPFIIFFGLMTVLCPAREKYRFRYLAFLLPCIVLSAWSYISASKGASYAFYAYAVICLIQIALILNSGKEKKSINVKIIGAGFAILAVIFVYNILLDMGWIKPFYGIMIDTGLGMLALMISNSICLSLDFARTNKDLKEQLRQVKELSEKTLEQERLALRQVTERELLEKDNERKTQELDEARRVQLSMLPRSIPKLPEVEIAVYMKTAAEVGGDYYDFRVSEDGTLTAAIGDATGHGTKAGTMVTIAKILFNEFSADKDLLNIFRKYTSAIKLMNLNQLYMGLALLRIKDNHLTIASAGMPPVLIYSKHRGKAEEIVLKGMPLGSFTDFPYQQKEVMLSEGDIILLLSDGFIEQFDAKKELLGIEPAKEILEASAAKSPDEIIHCLSEKIETWRTDHPQHDDITFVVLKVKCNS